MYRGKMREREMIVGGIFSPIYQYPYMVTIQYPSESSSTTSHSCGGMLIAPDVILTVAHCYNSQPDLLIQFRELISNMLPTLTQSESCIKGYPFPVIMTLVDAFPEALTIKDNAANYIKGFILKLRKSWILVHILTVMNK